VVDDDGDGDDDNDDDDDDEDTEDAGRETDDAWRMELTDRLTVLPNYAVQYNDNILIYIYKMDMDDWTGIHHQPHESLSSSGLLSQLVLVFSCPIFFFFFFFFSFSFSFSFFFSISIFFFSSPPRHDTLRLLHPHMLVIIQH